MSRVTESSPLSQSQTDSEILKFMEVANDLFAEGDYAEAEKYYESVLRLSPLYKGALFRKGVCRQYLDDYDGALLVFKELLRLYPEDSAIKVQLDQVIRWKSDLLITEANKLFLQDLYDEAEGYYNQVLELDPENKEASINKAIIRKYEGRFDEALELFQGLLRKFPDNVEILGEIAETQAWHEYYNQSIATYQKILMIQDSIPMRLKYAEILAWAGRFEEAKIEYRNILSIDSTMLQARLGLAEVYTFENNYGEALRIYRKMIEDQEDSFDAWYGPARLYMWMDMLDLARKKYEQLEESYPDNVLVKLDLQRLNYWQGLNKLALRNIEEILKRHPNHNLAVKLKTEILNNSRSFYKSCVDTFRDTGENAFYRFSQELNFRSDLQNRLWFRWDHWRTDDALDQVRRANSYGIHYFRRWSRLAATRAEFSLVQLIKREASDFSGWQGHILQSFNPIHRLQIDFSLKREFAFETPSLIENNISFDSIILDLKYKITPRFKALLGTTLSSVSDGNNRKTAFIGSVFRLSPDIGLIYRFRYMSYQRDLNSGYFSPQRYFSHEGRFSFHRKWDRIKMDVTGGFGLEKINQSSVALTRMLNFLLQYEINNNWMAEGRFGFSNSSIDSATGYSWYSFEARVQYRH